MKEALFYKKLKNKIVRCELCPRLCLISAGKRGNCCVRENIKGKLYSLVYGKAVAVNIDPIEKKPLYHFLPGSKVFSFGTAGCNLHCMFCQNWEISQAKPENRESDELNPKDIVKQAKWKGCKSIAYTYSEPTIFYEYMLDTAKLARKHGLKNVLVSNGFINEKPLKGLCKYIDAANIDLKAFSDEFYKKYTQSSLKPILNTLKILKKNKIHLEITNLIIPRLNDNKFEIDKMCRWIRNNLGKGTVIHFSRFFPSYKTYEYPTSLKVLNMAREIAKKYLDYVYVGNIHEKEGANTFCPKCKRLLIRRLGFSVIENNIKNGMCKCGKQIEGIWL